MLHKHKESETQTICYFISADFANLKHEASFLLHFSSFLCTAYQQ